MSDITQRITSITDILKKISDDKTLTLFNNIAVSNGGKYIPLKEMNLSTKQKYIPLKEMNLSTKQYYSRVSGLVKAGLIKRYKGKYSLTLLGKVVHDAQMTIGKALAYYWKLKVIESIEISSDGRLPKEELTELINTLIDSHSIKDIRIKEPYPLEDYQRHQHQQRIEAKPIR